MVALSSRRRSAIRRPIRRAGSTDPVAIRRLIHDKRARVHRDIADPAMQLRYADDGAVSYYESE